MKGKRYSHDYYVCNYLGQVWRSTTTYFNTDRGRRWKWYTGDKYDHPWRILGRTLWDLLRFVVTVVLSLIAICGGVIAAHVIAQGGVR